MMDQQAKRLCQRLAPTLATAFRIPVQYLERSESRSRTFSLASPLTLQHAFQQLQACKHSGSVRRFPAPHRHTGSLDPQRAAELRAAAASSPTTSPHGPSVGQFGSNGSLAVPAPIIRSVQQLRQRQQLFSKATFPAASRGVNGRPSRCHQRLARTCSTFRQLGVRVPTRRPRIRSNAPSHRLRSAATTRPSPRQGRMTRLGFPPLVHQAKAVSGAVASMVQMVGPAARMHQRANSLGGVKDVSNVPALAPSKMMKDFTKRTDVSGAYGDQNVHTRMTVGRFARSAHTEHGCLLVVL